MAYSSVKNQIKIRQKLYKIKDNPQHVSLRGIWERNRTNNASLSQRKEHFEEA
jgi:hypothetical protein